MLDDLSGVTIPDLDDPTYAPYWRALREKRLVLPRCDNCKSTAWPPRAACPACGGMSFAWTERVVSGTLYTWTTVYHATVPGFNQIPYAVGVIELADDPGVRLLGTILGDPDTLMIGLRMNGAFREAGREAKFVMLAWKPGQS